jgi:hypothetical protein
MGWLRRHYGAGPLHLFGLLVSFAVAAYVVTRILGAQGWKAIFLWFVVCLIVHDFIAWPLYTLADRIALRLDHRTGHGHPRVPWINHVRAPTIISGLLLVLFFPLIFRLSNSTYQPITGFDENIYLANWLVVTAILFGVSAGLYLGRYLMARRTVRPAAPDHR